ncbi:hypothetical protein [Clostridium beijerinckii]|nr:hypothetical protein [Clostridium beijerinckii]NOW07833.1 hypothetical protein [Clostridium beijerinckii]NYC04392.1 hypothetical protein [Clostridium beijerinckii]NYC05464.1 hypothetical protein [Clostridium beijerinckii]
MNIRQRKLNRSAKILMNKPPFIGWSYRKIRINLKRGAKAIRSWGFETRF